MKKLLFVSFVILMSVSCSPFRELAINNIKPGMSSHEVNKVLGRDSCLLKIVSNISGNNGTSAFILQYGNHDKYYLMGSKLFLKDNPKYIKSANNDPKCWLYFANRTLVYIKWGSTSQWNANTEMKEFVNFLLNNDPTNKWQLINRTVSKW